MLTYGILDILDIWQRKHNYMPDLIQSDSEPLESLPLNHIWIQSFSIEKESGVSGTHKNVLFRIWAGGLQPSSVWHQTECKTTSGRRFGISSGWVSFPFFFLPVNDYICPLHTYLSSKPLSSATSNFSFKISVHFYSFFTFLIGRNKKKRIFYSSLNSEVCSWHKLAYCISS